MKTYIKVLPLATALIFSYNIEAKTKAKQSKKVDVKCFVELAGGGEKVTFWNIPSKNLPGLSNVIVGQKVVTPNSKQKAQIYKAHECVLLKDDFTSRRAKIVDADTAR